MRILSIQSHVVSGYVGNRAASFPLQLLGHDVDVINTVQFSNHTGYGYTNGHKTTPEQLEAVFEGLKKNGIGGYDRVLTGYVPGAEALKVVGEQIRELKPDVYLLDRTSTLTATFAVRSCMREKHTILALAFISTPSLVFLIGSNPGIPPSQIRLRAVHGGLNPSEAG